MNNIRVQVSCLIIKDNKIAMIKKVNPKYATYNQYIPPGGHVEEYERLDEACAREVYEETGLIVNNLKLTGQVTFINRHKDYHSVCLFFVANEIKGSLHTKEPLKQTSHWINFEDILKNNEVPAYHREFIREIIINKNFINAQVEWELPNNEGLHWDLNTTNMIY